MECFIFLTSNGMFYTDYDWLDENRSKKLELIGCSDCAISHPISDLSKIIRDCSKVEIYNPVDKIAPYTFVFEEVIRRADNIDKLSFIYANANIRWSTHKPPNKISDPLGDIETLDIIYSGYSDISSCEERGILLKLFYVSWTRIHTMDDRQTILDGICQLDGISGTAYIIDVDGKPRIKGSILSEKVFQKYNMLSNFDTISITCRNDLKLLKVLLQIAKETNWEVTPIHIGDLRDKSNCKLIVGKDKAELKHRAQEILNTSGIKYC